MIGKRVGGRYQIISRLGEGGMAIVYKAKDLILDRFVAVKTLRPELADDEEFVRRFHREAESVTSLSHPNIVAIYDIGEEDCYYIVMEYVEGMTLKEFIRDYSPVSIDEAIHIMKQIILAIAHAHEHGIVHRDIKPQNILIDESEHVKVTDFGIALAVSGATITYTHSIMGSAHYLSPEQAKGGKATVKSDIYAIGIVMFELLTGKLPFPGTSPVSVALKHLSSPMPYPRDFRADIPQAVENVMIRALAKDPSDRYNHVTDMYQDILTALNPERAHELRLILNDPVENDEQEEDLEKTIKMAPIKKSAASEDRPDKKQPSTEKSKKKSRARKWLTASGILLLLITAGLVLGMTLLPRLFYVSNVRVPDVAGKTYQSAKKMLENQDLKVVRTDRVSNSVAKGKIISQNPEAGAEVKSGAEVALVVSKGAKSVSVDNYVGYSRETVSSVLEDAGFKDVVWHEEKSTSVPEDEIIKQNPKAGEKVVPSKTVLELTYSSGNPQVTVPDLDKKTKSEASKLLEDAGLKADFSQAEFSDTVEKGLVLDQNPAAGSLMERGASVTVTLSKGSEAKPKEIDQPIKVIYPGSNTPSQNGNGPSSKSEPTPIHVQIYYTDANHSDSLFADEKITETKTYAIPFTINPNEKGTYRVLIDGTERKTGTVDYPD
ncbi:Stk1 family PASTA domain-containing Ser/Thr kinase [Sporolactobacillus sp. CPB3-1]|uniref:non-specific serine/threonine protein kinase n=1 Tax=Sporolactobacillus mangiferae TaxID=2940498 RepID=A0ABT0M7R5_9BACL|nr:Stk1 family PASTA domain-containing Ser/Thr kinase [Sporolactobacillus mangiferae]MCL1630906.1 Stk1 family PASTA domain-containing Ser/Thr kinase [Sporolactobacillus mangiferae]